MAHLYYVIYIVHVRAWKITKFITYVLCAERITWWVQSVENMQRRTMAPMCIITLDVPLYTG